MKENSFTLKNTRSRRYPAETIIGADYADDLVLLSNIPALLHSLEQATRLIGLNANSNKTVHVF